MVKLTLSIIYIFSYLILIILTAVLFLFFSSSNLISQYSIPKVLIYIRRYNSFYLLFLISFLLLSGIPPLSFFFIKLNVIILISNSLINIKFILIFFIILFIMFFYLQIFYHKNIYINYIDILLSIKKVKKIHTSIFYLEIIEIFFFIFFFFIFFLFFFLDFFFIVNSLLI